MSLIKYMSHFYSVDLIYAAVTYDPTTLYSDKNKTVSVLYYVHPPGGWIYYFCFFRRPMSDVRRPVSGVRCPASRMVSAHLKEKY